MLKMIIEFDSQKLAARNLSLEKAFTQIHLFMDMSDISIIRDGYYEYEDSFDITPMMAIISYLSSCEWFIQCVCKWQFYDNESWNDLMKEWIYEKD